MVYADYEYYFNKYVGRVPRDSFNSLIIKASREIDKNVNTLLTESKISNLSEEAQEQLKYTACALVDLMEEKERFRKNNVSSIYIDGVSKNYKTFSNDMYQIELREAINGLPRELTSYL